MSDADIFRVLDELGLSYEKRASARGLPYAGFRLVGGPGTPVSLTAILENGVLRLTSHDLDSSASALDIVKAGARLPLGAAYRAPEDNVVELSVGVFVGEAGPSTELVRELIDYSVGGTATLASGGPIPHRPRVAGRRISQADIGTALAEYGHRLTPVDAGVRFEVRLTPGLRGAIVIGDEGDGWIVGSAGYLSDQVFVPNAQTIATLQKLQRWATAGRFVLDSSLMLRAHVPTPLIETPARSVVWTASQCAALLQTAAQHLRLPS